MISLFLNAKACLISACRIPWVYFRNALQLELCKPSDLKQPSDSFWGGGRKKKIPHQPVLPLSHLHLPLKWQITVLHLWKKSVSLSQKHRCSPVCHWVNVACPGNQIGTWRIVDDFLQQCNCYCLNLLFIILTPSVLLLWKLSGKEKKKKSKQKTPL